MRMRPAIWVSVAIALCCACGTPGAPQPPSLNLAKPVSDLRAVRITDKVTLTWTIPTQTTDGAAFRHRGQTRICRVVNQPNMERCGNPVSQIDTSTKAKSGEAITDLPMQDPAPTAYATYAVQVDNDRGRNAGLSNEVQIPVAATSTLNAKPIPQVTSDAVLVTANVTPRNMVLQQAMELRRKEKNIGEETVVARRILDLPNEGEAANVELRDDTFVWEKTYEYRVAIVGSAMVPDGHTVAFDAAVSPTFEVFAHDVFPPATPSGLQAVFSGRLGKQQPSIDLVWNSNTERDLAGYFIYRRRQGEPPASSTKLNSDPVSAPTYRDAAIQPGNAYIYFVVAVDERGNASGHSDEASEQVPK